MSTTQQQYWADKLQRKYASANWAGQPSLFVQAVRSYFPKTGNVLEVGCGMGQDGLWLAAQGYDVTLTDFIDNNFSAIIAQAQERGIQPKLQMLDVRNTSGLASASFDIAYAHLSLHYFDKQTTQAIFDELYRILQPNGVIAALFNSTSDPEYGASEQIEPHYFESGTIKRRYLDVAEAKAFAHKFEILLADDKGETYKDKAIGVTNLIRLVARKPHA